jgi:hypothetical protein
MSAHGSRNDTQSQLYIKTIERARATWWSADSLAGGSCCNFITERYSKEIPLDKQAASIGTIHACLMCVSWLYVVTHACLVSVSWIFVVTHACLMSVSWLYVITQYIITIDKSRGCWWSADTFAGGSCCNCIREIWQRDSTRQSRCLNGYRHTWLTSVSHDQM